jgi:hypothetical protein
LELLQLSVNVTTASMEIQILALYAIPTALSVVEPALVHAQIARLTPIELGTPVFVMMVGQATLTVVPSDTPLVLSVV